MIPGIDDSDYDLDAPEYMGGCGSHTHTYSIDIPVSDEIKLLTSIMSKRSPLYMVGDYVKDYLFWKLFAKDSTPPPMSSDVSFCSSMRPGELIYFLKNDAKAKAAKIRVFPKSDAYGAVSVIINKKTLNVATFRNKMKKEEEIAIYGTIDNDSRRHCMSVDALYYEIRRKSIVDFVQGIRDLKDKTIGIMGEPFDEFNKDRLQVLRFISTFSQFQGGGITLFEENVDKSTKYAIDKFQTMLGVPSRKISNEFIRGLQKSVYPDNYLGVLHHCGVLSRIFPFPYGDKFVHCRNPSIVIALLSSKVWDKTKHKEDFIKHLYVDLAFPLEIVEKVEFFLKLMTQDRHKFYEHISYYCETRDKLRAKYATIDDEVRLLANIAGMKKHLIETFLKYKLLVLGNCPQLATIGRKMLPHRLGALNSFKFRSLLVE